MNPTCAPNGPTGLPRSRGGEVGGAPASGAARLLRRALSLLLGLAAALFLLARVPVAAQPFALGGPSAPHMRAHLEAETLRPLPGGTVTLALVMTPEKGWHGYWENPGDAGQPMTLDWDLPSGVSAGALRYPVPQTLIVSGLMNHVYEGRYAVLADLALPVGLAPGARLPVRVQAHWLVCSDTLCVPEQADLALDLTVGAPGGAAGARNPAFDDYRRRLPSPLGAAATYQRLADGSVRLAIPYPAAAGLEAPHVFPLAAGAQSYAGEQRFARQGDRLIVELTKMGPGASGGGPGAQIFSGLLKIGRDRGVLVEARPGTVPAPAPEAAPGWGAALLALAGALVGGLILNAMPCVFPILSIKAMSLIRSGAAGGRAHHEAWAYTLGVMLTCVALGGAVLALRAGGESVGWAFQLQNPLVILLLLGLSVAIALAFLGVFALAPLQLDGRLMRGSGILADFWSGVLVGFVATPCTGPFMAAALGTALLLPVGAALAVFAGLGLGIALPFLLLAYVPALRRRVPRPGAWMERVQRWLAVPMALTAAALLWLLYRQAGTTGLLLGAAVALGLTLILWPLGRAQRSGKAGQGRLAALACALLLGGAATILHLEAGPAALEARGADAFDEAALARARASGRPVFVYFTADWCLTCKVNEAAAIDRAEVRAAFRKAGVRTLVGDWTRGDPAITRFLAAQGRSGVPLYLWYPADGGPAQALPQVLTPATLVDRAEGKGA